MQCKPTVIWHFPLVLQVALVPDNHHGEAVLVLDSQDLLLEGRDLLEALAGCDGVDKQKALAGAHVLLAHRRVLFLAGRVEHVEEGDLVVNDALLPVRVCVTRGLARAAARGNAGMRTLNCRVILVDEVGLDELDREARLADTTSADHHQLVFSGELRRRHQLATPDNRATPTGAAVGGRRQTLDAIASTGRGKVGWIRRKQWTCRMGMGVSQGGDSGSEDSEAAAEGASSSVGDPRIALDGRCFEG